MIPLLKRPIVGLELAACLAGFACRTNETPEAQVNDLQITSQIKAKLAEDIGPSSVTNISVNSTNGVVTMSGQVDSAAVKAKAVAIAKSIPKVVRVVDGLQVAVKAGAVILPGEPFSPAAPTGRIALPSAAPIAPPLREG